MKIAFMISTIGLNGAERVITNLANKFADIDGCSVYIIVKYVLANEYELHHKIKRINLPPKKNRLYGIYHNIRFVRTLCLDEEIDILVNFMAASNIKGVLATWGTKTKCIVSVRNDPNKEYENISMKILAKILFLKADGIVFQTKGEAEWFSDKIRKKGIIIPNPVGDKFYLTNRDYDKIKKRDNIVAVGRLETQKNHKLLLSAFKKINKKYPNEKLVIYGQGSLACELKKIIEENGLSNNVCLAGEVKNIWDHIRTAKMFVMTSDYEGIPNSMLEAMALGIPIICTDCPAGGPRECITDGVDGILVNVGDEKGVTNAINSMLENQKWSYSLGQAARRKAVDFKENVVFEKWKEYILSFLTV